MIRNRLGKRAVLAGMAGLLMLGLGSCGKKPAETTPAASTEAAQPETKTPESDGAEQETQAEDNQAVDLSRIKLPELAFTRANFPRLNGSTSCVPLGKTLAAVLLGETEAEVSDLIHFQRTTQSFRDLMAGDSDLLIVGEPNAAVYDEMEEAGFAYDLEPIATDALIFVVNEDNPVDNLSTGQIRDIYTGKITNWKEVGGNDAPIVPFQRNEGAGSQALMKKLIMKDTPMMDAPTSYVASEMGELMTAVKSYDNSANAIGYSVYYYANDMRMSQGLKIISIDGVEPKADTIRAKEYPHLNAYYCVIPQKETAGSPARAIYDWLASEDGQILVASRGYVSVIDTGIHAEALSFEENIYTRMEGDLSRLTPGTDYGHLYPYTGLSMYTNDGNGYAYRSGSMYGFFDEKGRIVTDPVYCRIEPAFAYSSVDWSEKAVGAYIVSMEAEIVARGEEEGWAEYRSRFVSADGSFVSEPYMCMIFQEDAVLAADSYDGDTFVVYDLSGRKLFDQDDFRRINRDFPELDTSGAGFESAEGIFALNFGNGSYYCDRSGRILSGPYEYAQPYIDGIALVSLLNDGGYAIVDTEGQVLYQSDAYSMYRLTNGSIVETFDDTYSRIIDTEGNLIHEIEGETVSGSRNGFHTSHMEDGVTVTTYYDFDGNVLFIDDAEEYEDLSDIGLLAKKIKELDEDHFDFEILSLKNGKRIKVENASYMQIFWTMEGISGLPMLLAVEYDADYNSTYRVYNVDTLKPVAEGSGYAYATMDGLTGDWYLQCSDENNNCTIYRADGSKLADFPESVRIYDGRMVSENDHATTSYDPSGRAVFRYNYANGDD